MPRSTNLVRKGRPQSLVKTKSPAAQRRAAARGVCVQVMTRTPKKPNPPWRKVAQGAVYQRPGSHRLYPRRRQQFFAGTLHRPRSRRSREGFAGVRYYIVRGTLDAPWARLAQQHEQAHPQRLALQVRLKKPKKGGAARRERRNNPFS